MDIEFLQPWVTVQGTSPAVTSVIQDQEDWLDIREYSEVNAWIDVRSVSALASGSITLAIESATIEGEKFFAPIGDAVMLNASSGPFLISSVAGAASVSPAARFLRWRVMSMPTTASGTWSATFRIRVACSRSSTFVPTHAPGCVLWLRADLGLTTSGGSAMTVTGWADQSGFAGNNLGPSTGGMPTLVQGLAAFNGFPVLNFAGGASLVTASSGAGVLIPASTPTSALVVCQTQTVQAANQVLMAGQTSNNMKIAESASLANQLTLSSGSTVTANVAQNLNADASILQVDWDGASTLVYQNAVVQGAAVSPGFAGMNFAAVGANFNATNPFDGWIAEVLLYNRPLTAVWRTMVSRYLGKRYGIAVP